MPCYTTRTVSLEIKNANLEYLAQAISDVVGVKATVHDNNLVTCYSRKANVSFQHGRLQVRSYQGTQLGGEIVQGVRKRLTEINFMKSATRLGFNVKRNQQGQLVAERRSYGR